ncbi:MAG: hypothetical protein OXH47_10065 [Paracoccaceae bacterium]|nr:hypothetical protein [Paracoccaceae bacterium]
MVDFHEQCHESLAGDKGQGPMMISFFNHGTGSGQRASTYLLSLRDHKQQERPGIRVLRGDPARVGRVADSLDFKQRYTSGVLAWAPEGKPTDAQIGQVLDSFEKTALAGLDADRWCWTAVRHDEQGGGVHVHIVGARVDLKTGKSLNIAPPGWQGLFIPWCNMWNWQEGWARPDDPARRRTVQPGKDVDGLRRRITTHLENLIVEGDIVDRPGIVKELGELGTITREGKNYITVIPQGMDRKIRLKGAIYEREFNAGTFRKDGPAPEPCEAEQARLREAGITETRQRVEAALAKRARFHKKRYGAIAAGTQEPGQSPEHGQPFPHREPGNNGSGRAGQSGLELVARPSPIPTFDNQGDGIEGNRSGDGGYRGKRLPAPGLGAEDAGDIFGWRTIPRPMVNQDRRMNDGVDRAGKPHAGTNEKDAGRHEQAGRSVEGHDNRMAEANQILGEFNRSVEEGQRKYKRIERAIEQLRKAFDRLGAAAERIREQLTGRRKPPEEENRESHKSTWYEENPFDLAPRPPGF